MRGAGFDVETFEDGAPFLASIERAVPDCVVLDLHMPRLSGFEVLDALNEQRSRIPVIVITGHDSPESAVQARVAGAFAYLRKPVDGNELLDAITRAATAAAAATKS